MAYTCIECEFLDEAASDRTSLPEYFSFWSGSNEAQPDFT